jgi:Tfp pilus assembly protein PilF
MKPAFALLLLAMLAGCATTTSAPPPSLAEPMFHDELFAAPTEPVDAARIFALSEPMRRYLAEDIAAQLRTQGPQAGLLDALYRKGQLKLEYDASVTRNAAEAFAARAGNCLSLVVMTAALAKELNLTVRYQSAYLEETWSRTGNLLMRSSHVNLTLGPRKGDEHSRFGNSLTIDFLPPEDLRGLRTVEIPERTIVAMFMNNRAVEALVQGRVDDAYAWVREAIRQDAGFNGAYNTLGTVYLRHGALAHAAQVFRHALALERDNTRVIANLAQTLTQQGEAAEAQRLLTRLAQLEQAPPFHYYKLGLAAMRRDDFQAARDLFAKEVERAEYNAEFQYWMGVVSLKLGDLATASRHLALAREYSTTRGEREQYAAKLAVLKANARR